MWLIEFNNIINVGLKYIFMIVTHQLIKLLFLSKKKELIKLL